MRIDEKINSLQNLINKKVTYEDVAHALDMSGNALRNWVYRNRELKEFEIRKIDNYFNISTQNTTLVKDDTSHLTLDYYPDVFGSCGNGVFQFSTKREQITVPKNVILKNLTPGKQYFVINAYGNSMEPYIYDNDKLVVENYDGEQIIDNTPYVFAYQDEIFIKRLSKNVDQLIITSDNPTYDARKLTGAQLKDVNIIGQIVGLMRDLRL